MSTIFSIHGSTSLRCLAQDHYGPSLSCDVCKNLMLLIQRYFKEADFKDPMVYIPQSQLESYFRFWAQLNKIPITNDIKTVTHSLLLWDGAPHTTLPTIGKEVVMFNMGAKKVKLKKPRAYKPKSPAKQIKPRKIKIGKL